MCVVQDSAVLRQLVVRLSEQLSRQLGQAILHCVCVCVVQDSAVLRQLVVRLSEQLSRQLGQAILHCVCVCVVQDSAVLRQLVVRLSEQLSRQLGQAILHCVCVCVLYRTLRCCGSWWCGSVSSSPAAGPGFPSLCVCVVQDSAVLLLYNTHTHTQ